MTAEQMIEMYKKHGDKLMVIINPERSLSQMISSAQSSFGYLGRLKSICIVEAPRDCLYITGDIPVYTWNPNTKSYYPGISALGLRDTVVGFALDKKHHLILLDKGPDFRHTFATRESTRAGNCYLAEMSFGFICSSNREHLESIVKHTKLEDKIPKPMFSVS